MARSASRLPVACLDAVLTTACNMNCDYCYQDARNNRRMNWTTLRSAIDLLLASDFEDVRLVFYGGEPLLEFAMIRRAVAYAETVKPAGKRLRYGVVTNGTLLGPEVAAFLATHGIETRLSFDGVPAAQDLRGTGTFRLLNSLLENLRAHHRTFFENGLVINVTFHARSLRYLAHSIDYFLEKRVHSILLGPTVTPDKDWRPDSIDDLDAQFDRIYRSCLRHYRRTGTIPLVIFRKAETRGVPEPLDLPLCGVGRGENLAVDPDGAVHGCVMFVGAYQRLPSPDLRRRLARMGMGNLLDGGLSKRHRLYPTAARAARIFNDRQLKYSSYGRCSECRFVASCAVCPISIGHASGGTDPHRIPDSVCAFNLVSLKYRQRFPTPLGAYEFFAGTAPLPIEMLELRSFVLSRQTLPPRSSP
jgi:sulfatase maturation enzyme AslB (radical SAM superfamily)